ncbi:transcriptional regulator, TetR family protein [Bacillus methanolicus PB1]|uniref:Transcriptional regulator, TetR family protein n=1 Tax=Bacillus methanolicus PB1 TaxID=997296 RepID=I3E246_BACMT|nr:TetR/AcrR family transcriptional regulator [Bacillus methanolicus]EIJ80567.1 transcriptional regulator, TetR family protein [Bacillus methanolicus PB1]
MKEKEKLIIDAAMKLFANKGFAATSIQEIANKAGISKGAFYIYFKSKESLLIAIFKYYYETIKARMDEIKSLDLPPRDMFVEHIVCLYSEICKHKEFIIMQTREQAIPFNESIAEFVNSMHIETYQFYKKSMTAIYGKNIVPYLGDLSIILQGIFHSYLQLILFQNNSIDFYKLAGFILRRADDLANGLMKSEEEQIVPPQLLNQALLDSHFFQKKLNKKDILLLIKELKADLETSSDLFVTLDVLEAEINNEAPRIPVIQGMLANLKNIKETKELKLQIEKFFGLRKRS